MREQVGQHEGPPTPSQVGAVPPDSSRSESGPSLRRQLAVSFSVVGGLGILLCGVLTLLVGSVSAALDTVRDDAESTRLALGLSLAVREQYIHEAHTILEGNATHLHHHDRWVARARREAEALDGREPSPAEGHARRVAAASAELDALFADRIVPAALSQDAVAVRRAHAEAEALARRAQADSDALVAALDRRGAAVHDEALSRSRVALWISLAGTLSLLGLSVALFLRLRRSLVSPLRSLSSAARAVTSGRGDVRVEARGVGEVATVARAFESMTAQLRRRGQDLVRAERMAALGELSQAVADAIREPCDRVRHELRSMRSDTSYDGMSAELAILSEEVDACHRIVDDLLTWARAPQLARADQDVAEVVRSAAERFSATSLGEAIVLDLDLEACVLSLDAVRVRQVVANLLRNAAQASPRGTVRIEGRRGAEGYRLSITDDGPGVRPDRLSRLFEPFYTGGRGTGLGLAVCHGIVTAHGGRIGAAAGPRGGLAVTLELPSIGRGEDELD